MKQLQYNARIAILLIKTINNLESLKVEERVASDGHDMKADASSEEEFTNTPR